MKFPEFAEKFGLSNRQSRVYECLFSYGSASAADIVRETGINRTLVYDCLNLLVEKGLASFVDVNNRRVFSALSPRALARNLEDQLGELEERKRKELEELRHSLPELERRFNKSDRASVGVLLGKKGARNLFRDITSSLKRGQEDLVFIANHEGRELLGSTILNYYAQCAKKGIGVRAIFDSRPKTVVVAKETAKLPLVMVRFLPREYATLTTFHVYGKKASMLLFSEGEMFGLLMENEKVASGLRKQFEALWKSASRNPHKL